MSQAKSASSYILARVEALVRHWDEEREQGLIDLICKSPQVFVYGVGRSGLVGKAFAIRLVQLGLKVFFVGETITPIVNPGDLVIVLSYTGETMSAIQTANIARRVGAQVVVITGRTGTKLGHTANLLIPIDIPPDEQKPQRAPLGTLFEDATLIYLDGIAAAVMEKLHQTEAEMRARHAIMV